MLPALGVLLRPPWLCKARMLRARDILLKSHPTNIYDTRHGTTLSLRHAHLGVDQPESSKNPRDISDDSTLPVKTSILIEKNLPKLLPEHSPGDAIFEVEGQEYLALASTLPPGNSTNSSLHSLDHLVKLVKIRDYDQAYLLLKDIQDLNITIPTSMVYEAPAQAALRNGDLPSNARIELFTAWFSLIPPITDKVKYGLFNETCHLIVQAKIPNLALICAFAKIMASKGYGQLISGKVIPFIIRYASFEVGLNFLDEFNDANAEYWATHNSMVAAKQIDRLSDVVRGLAVRVLVLSDRVDDALCLLPDPGDSRFRLASFTYDVLLRRLEKSRNVVHRQHIPLVEKLRSHESTAVFENEHVNPFITYAEEAAMASNISSALPIDLTDNLVMDLRYLKLTFFVDDLIPHPFTIVNFMNAYLATGRSRALELLYYRAARTSYRILSTFIFAEMLFYHRLRQYFLVVETFVDHFYLIGVPRENVLLRYNRLCAQRRAFNQNTPGHPPPERCYKVNPDKILPKGKIWPSSSHCNILYHALVALTPPGPAIESLYQEFLLIIEHGKDTPTTEAIASLEPLAIELKGRPSSGAFTPFFRHLMSVFGATRGTKILSDMVRLDIRPTIYHYTELASFYATNGDSKKALIILDNLEGRFKTFERATQDKTMGSYDQGDIEELETPESPHLPAPDLVMYNSLMRGFILSKNVSAATKVADRLMRRHKHRRGEDRYLDEILREIDIMKEEHEQQARFSN